MKNNVIIISAHPDDETLGAGGTLLRHNSKGDKLFWIIGTEMSLSKSYSKDQIKSRNNEIEKVAKFYGFKKVFRLNFETSKLDSSSLIKLVPLISEIFKEVEPNIIYNLNLNDAHSDHRVLSEAVMANTKAFRHPYIKKVLMYECISETEFSAQLPERIFIPNYFVDISSFLDDKLKIMEIYKSEIDVHPFPRSIENIKALSIYRGATANVKYAEAFQVVKILI
jgi:N-acetylglucosamine malate deacetylase 1